jgi:hypothetical protein
MKGDGGGVSSACTRGLGGLVQSARHSPVATQRLLPHQPTHCLTRTAGDAGGVVQSRFVLQQRDLGSLHLPPALQTALLEKFAEVETEAPQKRNDIIAPAEATEEVARRVQYQRPQQKRDLLLCYILLLCLMINDYDIGLKELAMEFQLQPKQLSLYFSELGCVVTAKRQQGGEEKSSTLRARLLQADARGRTLEELLPNRKPRPKAQRRG